MNSKKIFAQRVVTAMLLLLMSFGGTAFGQNSRAADREEREYQRGMRLLNNHEYDEAERIFTALSEGEGARVASALYWRAWTLNRLNKPSEALQALVRLEREFGESSWADDGEALELEIRQASGQRISPDSVEDEEVRLMAIHSLAMNDPERALPILEKILKGPYSMKMKEKALFVLTQSRSREGASMLGRIARGEMNPDLQLEAIQYIAAMGSKEARELLGQIYESASSKLVKEKILDSYLVSGNRTRILAAAKNEPDPDLRGKAISLLGVTGAKKELAALYDSERNTELRKKVIEAMFVSHDEKAIERIARNEQNQELRVKAIESLGVMGKSTGPILVELYEKESDRKLKEKIASGLFVQSNATALIALAEKEQNRDLRKKLIEMLSIMNSPEAREYMMKILGVS